MKKHKHKCPVSWYIGQFFAGKRQECHLSEQQLATALGISVDEVIGFEKGEYVLDAQFLLKLEKMFQVKFEDYKPPVSYYGFLGVEADEENMLQATKKIALKVKNIFKDKEAETLENKLLKLRYASLRGPKSVQDD